MRTSGWLQGVAFTGVAGMAYAGLTLQTRPTAPDFTRDIAPIFKSKCAVCHGAELASGGLALDTPAAVKKGGASGKLYEPGNGAQSLLIHRIKGLDGKPRMPMGFAPLSSQETSKIVDWIDAGSSFGATRAKHWAYVPPRRPVLPKTRNTKWIRNPIDTFVLARLEKEGLTPSPEANKETLLRRLSLDLTGLPPAVEVIDAFLADKRPDAYERIVDRLLASPHFGEKMARAWLDLARYADTNGYEKDLPRQMWLWRDWVIRAFNQNMPFDEFTIEQLAGDLLTKPTMDQLIATGFHRNSMLNDEGGIDAEEFRVVAVMDRVDATATTWLGTTMACAQCHDHKYDPFSQRDYYRFYAFFNQTEDNGRDKDPMLKVPNAAQKSEIDRLELALADAKQDRADRVPSVLAEMPAWEKMVLDGWSVLKPATWKSQARLTPQSDGSLLASGPDPVQDEYFVTYPLDGGTLNGLRIEAIPDPSLPEGSSGRNFNGNFVLRKLEAKLLNASGEEEPITFESAAADFTQGGHDPKSVIQDGEKPGWAIAGFEPKNRVLHTLVLNLKQPVAHSKGDRLELRFIHQSKHKNHNLGRFRVAKTSDSELAKQTPPTAARLQALSKRHEARTEAESTDLKEFYLSQASDLAEVRLRITDLEKKVAELEGSLATTLVLRQAEKPRPNYLLKRGDFRAPADPVSPGVPVALGGFAARSNRLGLAKWLVDGKNPLTARVQVNRIWEGLFGQGLVATLEDFGTQGQPPTHPELLDWLATEYVAQKWNTKKLIRTIVTSATYRQSSKTTAGHLRKDPNNLLYARAPRFRVEAEGIRDIALKASGRLTATIGGPSVMPPQPPGIWENSFTFYDTKDRWVDEEGPNRYRRGLYTYWRRTAPFPMALTFDLRNRDVCIPKRSRTNTPLQALNTLNDPIFLECAGALAKRMVHVTDEAWRRGTPKTRSDDAGLTYGFRACTSRYPKPNELQALRKLLEASYQKLAADGDAAVKLLNAAKLTDKPELTTQNAAFTVVANALLNLDETIVRG